MSRAALCALGLGLLVAACATPKVTPGPMIGVAADQFPAPDVVQAAAHQDYRISAGDDIEVQVFRVPELNRKGQVTGSGTFFMPQVGEVAVAGKTSAEAASAIAAALTPNYVVNPQVTVAVDETNVEHFTIEGAVNAPGIYEVPGSLTLLQAIATAKGIQSSGAGVKQVVVFRVIDGQKWANVYDLTAIRAAKAVDPRIYPNDLIDIPSDNRFETLRNVIGAVPLFSLFLR